MYSLLLSSAPTHPRSSHTLEYRVPAVSGGREATGRGIYGTELNITERLQVKEIKRLRL